MDIFLHMEQTACGSLTSYCLLKQHHQHHHPLPHSGMTCGNTNHWIQNTWAVLHKVVWTGWVPGQHPNYPLNVQVNRVQLFQQLDEPSWNQLKNSYPFRKVTYPTLGKENYVQKCLWGRDMLVPNPFSHFQSSASTSSRHDRTCASIASGWNLSSQISDFWSGAIATTLEITLGNRFSDSTNADFFRFILGGIWPYTSLPKQVLFQTLFPASLKFH